MSNERIRVQRIIDNQKAFQEAVGFPINSISEVDRNEMGEKYVFKLIEEAVELRREFPSSINPWSKKQKPADLARIREEFADVFLFLINIAIVWHIDPAEILSILEGVQENNFKNLKRKKMDIVNTDILKVPGQVSGIGSGNLNPRYVFIGQNPGKGITRGYEFFSNPEDGSSKVLLPILKELGIVGYCYFTNVVKSTTPDNKVPDEGLTKFSMEFLRRELDVLRLGNPEMKVIAMGNWAKDALGDLADVSIPHPATVLYGSIDKGEYAEEIERAIQPLQ